MEYACIFGISSGIAGLLVGEQINAFFDHLTIITIHGKHGRIYWFVIRKLPTKYTYPEAPHFTTDDAALAAAELRNVRLYKHITFGHLWDTREVASMTALEENVFRMWHYDRVVLMGDSVHKVLSSVNTQMVLLW